MRGPCDSPSLAPVDPSPPPFPFPFPFPPFPEEATAADAGGAFAPGGAGSSGGAVMPRSPVGAGAGGFTGVVMLARLPSAEGGDVEAGPPIGGSSVPKGTGRVSPMFGAVGGPPAATPAGADEPGVPGLPPVPVPPGAAVEGVAGAEPSEAPGKASDRGLEDPAPGRVSGRGLEDPAPATPPPAPGPPAGAGDTSRTPDCDPADSGFAGLPTRPPPPPLAAAGERGSQARP